MYEDGEPKSRRCWVLGTGARRDLHLLDSELPGPGQDRRQPQSHSNRRRVRPGEVALD
jgi:hypothetical protein